MCSCAELFGFFYLFKIWSCCTRNKGRGDITLGYIFTCPVAVFSFPFSPHFYFSSFLLPYPLPFLACALDPPLAPSWCACPLVGCGWRGNYAVSVHFSMYMLTVWCHHVHNGEWLGVVTCLASPTPGITIDADAHYVHCVRTLLYNASNWTSVIDLTRYDSLGGFDRFSQQWLPVRQP